MPSIALPTADKQDRILNHVKNITGNKDIIPIYNEEVTIVRKTPVNALGLKQLSGYAFLLRDTDRNIVVFHNYNTKTFMVLNATTYELITSYVLPYLFHNGNNPCAYDGTYIYGLFIYGSGIYMFARIDVMTGQCTYNPGQTYPTTTYNLTQCQWMIDRETGYLYLGDYSDSSFYVIKDPINNLTLTTGTYVKKTTLPQCVAMASMIVNGKLFVTGLRPNTNYLTVCIVDRETLSPISSFVSPLTSANSHTTLFANKDKTKVYEIHDGADRAFAIDLATLNVTEYNARSEFSRLGTWYNDIDDTIVTFDYTSESGSPTRYYVSTVDANSGYLISRKTVRNDLDITNIYDPQVDFSTINPTIYGIFGNTRGTYDIAEFTTVYTIDSYRDLFEEEK